MSHVLSAMLMVVYDDEGDRSAELTALMSRLRSGGAGYSWKKIDDGAGGNKRMQVDVYGAGLNFADPAELAQLLANGVEWPLPEAVFLWWLDEHDDEPAHIPLWPLRRTQI